MKMRRGGAVKIERTIEELSFGFGMLACVEVECIADGTIDSEGMTYEFRNNIEVTDVTLFDVNGEQIAINFTDEPDCAAAVMLLDAAKFQFAEMVNHDGFSDVVYEEIATELQHREQAALEDKWERMREARMCDNPKA